MIKQKQIRDSLVSKLSRYFGMSPAEAGEEQIYKATVLTVRDILAQKNRAFSERVKAGEQKRVYYICLEFLVGRSLRLNLNNLGLEQAYREALADLGFDLDAIYEKEPDPGLGNGGLGRLAACFMDSLSTLAYPARGFSILYEYGLFRQRIVDGEQLELPDVWLPEGEVWLVPRQDRAVTVRFGGRVEERWENGVCHITQYDCDEVEAVPYDMFISGADSEAVSVLRLWKARDIRNFNMEAFSQGQYIKAVEENTMAETISKVLYPADNHPEGKLLRLSQQYFLVCASLQNILNNHFAQYKTFDNLPDKVAIHINDTHPALVIPELMRVLVDQHQFPWEKAWDITVRTVSYTNHTVMPEALECWNEDLFRVKLPRIHAIIHEINERFCAQAWRLWQGDWEKIGRMSIINRTQIAVGQVVRGILRQRILGTAGLAQELRSLGIACRAVKREAHQIAAVTVEFAAGSRKSVQMPDGLVIVAQVKPRFGDDALQFLPAFGHGAAHQFVAVLDDITVVSVAEFDLQEVIRHHGTVGIAALQGREALFRTPVAPFGIVDIGFVIECMVGIFALGADAVKITESLVVIAVGEFDIAHADVVLLLA